MRVFLLLLFSIGSFGAIDRNPPNCSSRPCTYTLTCAASVCTSSESAELQTVLNEAYRGDTIKLEAGRTWTGTSSNFNVTGRPGSSGYLTITTTQDNRLPNPGTRITPHYRDVMPTIRNGVGNTVAFTFQWGSNPANFVKIVGVRFDTQGGTTPLIRIGYNITSPTQDPYDIILDRCIVENSQWLTTAGMMIGSRGRRSDIINSYIQGSIKSPSAEVQNISFVWGEHRILNNYIAENQGENIMFGGTRADIDVDHYTYSSGELAYNAIVNHKERVPHLAWQPNTRYFKSVHVRNGGIDYRASNSGTSGSSFSTSDNGINWVQVSGAPSSKNVLELKSAKDMNIHHNTIQGFWTKAQYEIVVFKLSNSSHSPANCRPTFSGRVNTNLTDVTSADGQPLPDLWWGSNSTGSSCDITINGVAHKIASFNISNPQQIILAASAGSQTNVPYSYGDSNCIGAYFQNIAFEHNVIRHGPQAFQIISMNNARSSRIGNIRVRNNLMYDIDRTKYCMVASDCGMSRTALQFAQIPYGVDFSNNTVVNTANLPHGVTWEGGYQCRGGCRSISPCVESGGMYMPIAGDTRFANNIFPRGTSSAMHGYTPLTTGGPAITGQKICEGGCTKSLWDGNIIVGGDITGYPAGTYNMCPSVSGCAVDYDYDDPTYGRLFENYLAMNLKVRTGHYAQKGGMFARQIGADWDALPIVTRPSDGGIGVDISTTATTATLSYNVTAPIRHIPCVVEASTTPDIEGGRITDLNAATYLRPDVDGPANSISRSVTIGSRSALSSGTTYYVRLHCGGAFWEGEFKTQ